ncbi:MAG: hypothetical protein ABIQ35_01585 [Verrucomicrobiota bacterium]
MKRFRYIWLCTFGLLFFWLIYLVWGLPASKDLAARFSGAVLRVTQGKATNPALFIHRRFFEGLCLTTLLVAWFWWHLGVTQVFSKKPEKRTLHWVVHSVSGFLLFNLWLGFAMQTTFFWGLMWQGNDTQNLTRFHLKRLLFAENQSTAKAAILGSSQSRAQIDEELLNKLLQSQPRTEELHFPGSNAYDIWLIHRKITKLHPRWIIVYLSESTFYSGNHHDVAANFFQFSDVGDLLAKDVRAHVPHKGFGYGLLGAALPIFRLREVLSQRLLGSGINQLKQRQYDEKFSENLNSTAQRIAEGYRIDKSSEFEIRAFSNFVSDCEQGNERVLILTGQLNPILSQHFDPAIRPHMLSFLQKLRDQHSNIVLVEDLPFQSPADYEDLTHVKNETEIKFTEWVSKILLRSALESPDSTVTQKAKSENTN